MYKITLQVPLVLEPEISQLLFDCGSFIISTKKNKHTIKLTAHAQKLAPFYKQFDKELLTIKKYVSKKIAAQTVFFAYDKKQKPLSLICHDAFGDGNHPTTKMCVNFLKKLLSKKSHKIQSLCDIGTGAGILSLIAYHYGLSDILALDYDKTALARTKQNMLKNKTRFQVKLQDIIRQPIARKYDLVIANMNSAILEAGWKNITAAVAPRGKLILSGIGTQWVPDIRRIVLQSNFIIKSEQQSGGWWAAVCIQAPKGVK